MTVTGINFDDSPEERAFRSQARAWLEEHAPKLGGEDDWVTARSEGRISEAEWVERSKAWQGVLAEHGWACINWPAEHGGRGGSATGARIFAQEQANFGVSNGVFAVGLGMAAPTIIAHGTDEQKQRFLEPLRRGEQVWCQLFSEPGAGSDLAAVATKAERDGGEWVVTGQKVWTSGAHYSDFGILLARTDWDVPKHRGITYFLVDMSSPGIEIRPLRQNTGEAHFSEVFLTGVRTPGENVLGEVNGGWGVAMTTLANERVFIGGGSSNAPTTDELIALARRRGVHEDPTVRQGLAAAYAREQILKFIGYRIQTASSRGEAPGVEASVMKLAYASHLKSTADLSMRLDGAASMLAGTDAPDGGVRVRNFLAAPSIRIAGGTDEVQRNVVGERSLGLPREPRLDRDVPFRELPRSG